MSDLLTGLIEGIKVADPRAIRVVVQIVGAITVAQLTDQQIDDIVYLRNKANNARSAKR